MSKLFRIGLLALLSLAHAPADLQLSRVFGNNRMYAVEYLAVAGGGGGGRGPVAGGIFPGGGGGGAGGFLTGSATARIGIPWTVTVGAGGAESTVGGNSAIVGVTAPVGGGFGAPHDGPDAGNGGSGGGARGNSVVGTGTSGQGNNGGTTHGGGGGAGAVGGDGSGGALGGNGGAGLASSISGASVTYAGGGGGSHFDKGNGGAGGGGNASASSGAGSAAAAGTANTGGGGGGGSYNTAEHRGQPGGSGIVIIRYLGPQRATGGTITSSGGYTIHTFTASGTFTP